LARLPYTNIIYDSAKARAIKWKPARDMLIQQGKNPKLINELDTHNLEILEEEEQLKSFGIDTSELPRRYKVNNKDFDAFYQFLITVHALFAGLTIDIHYLIHHDVTPLLPQLLSELLVGDKQIIGEIISNYQGVYQSLGNERSAWIPELVLDLANSLSHLPDQSWAREQLNSSVRYWLSSRGVTTDSNSFLDLREISPSVSTSQDREYLEKLKQCLVRLGDTQSVNKVIDVWLKNSVLIETLPFEIKLEFPGGIKLEMVKITAGSFMMGSNEDYTAKPSHKVTLKEFYLGKYPVTQEQYEAVMGDNPSEFKDNPKNPVECVSWNEAQKFCQKLKKLTGKDFRLPTEAEWEYACRAGTQTLYYFGDDENQLGEYAWFDKNVESKTHPVGQKKPNNWELYDMIGNVREWCEDLWHDNYAEKPDNIKNNGNTAWPSGDEYDCYIIRGGSWQGVSDNCCSASRDRCYPHFKVCVFGFRLALGSL
jgi:formylglycine-generating enzyme required for sulfatase activity